ncbi:hypothetical protein, partial [Frankia sp. CpI1-P]
NKKSALARAHASLTAG